MKKLLLLAFLPLTLVAQQQGAYPWVYSIQNDTSTGTTAFKLAKLNSSGNAVVAATTDSSGVVGVCVSNCGTTGSALISYAGLVPLIMDGTATAQHYVQISSSVGGDGVDSGAATYPASSNQVVGRVQTGCTGVGCTAMALIVFESHGSSGATTNQNIRQLGATFVNGGSALTGSTTVCGYLAYGGTIQQVTLLADVSGSVTVDVKTVAYSSYTGPASASSITAAAIPALSSAVKFKDSTLTGWTTSISADTVVCFALSSPTTVASVQIELKIAAN